MTDHERNEKFLKQLAMMEPDEWLSLVRYFAQHICATDQTLMADIIAEEAERRAARQNLRSKESGDKRWVAKSSTYYVSEVLLHLGLKVVLAGQPAGR